MLDFKGPFVRITLGHQPSATTALKSTPPCWIVNMEPYPSRLRTFGTGHSSSCNPLPSSWANQVIFSVLYAHYIDVLSFNKFNYPEHYGLARKSDHFMLRGNMLTSHGMHSGQDGES